MTHFPVFLNLDNKKVLIIGAGKIANRKIDKLLDFTNDITIICENIHENIEEKIVKNKLKYLKRKYENNDISTYDIVVCATNDLELQKQLYHKSREFKTLYNCVDFPELCDFSFSSYTKKDDLIISISTSGNAPSISIQLKNYIERLLPSDLGEFLEEMKGYRNSMPKGQKRMDFLKLKAKEYFDKLK